MSARKWKDKRTAPSRYADSVDRKARKSIKPPWYIVFAGWFVPSARESWLFRWERAHKKALRFAVKKLSHGARG